MDEYHYLMYMYMHSVDASNQMILLNHIVINMHRINVQSILLKLDDGFTILFSVKQVDPKSNFDLN